MSDSSVGRNTAAGLDGWRERQQAGTASRVARAIEGLAEENARVTFYSVAERAQVARSTLYRRPELRAMVESARDRSESSPCQKKQQANAEGDMATILRLLRKLDARIPAITYQVVPF